MANPPEPDTTGRGCLLRSLKNRVRRQQHTVMHKQDQNHDSADCGLSPETVTETMTHPDGPGAKPGCRRGFEHADSVPSKTYDRQPPQTSERRPLPECTHRWFGREPSRGTLFFHMTPAQSPESDQHGVRSTMPTYPDTSESRPRSGDSHASPATSEVPQIGNELAARRNANLFTGAGFTCPEFTWLD